MVAFVESPTKFCTCTMLAARILGPKYWAFAQDSDFVLLKWQFMNQRIWKELNMTDGLELNFKGSTSWSVLCKLAFT